MPDCATGVPVGTAVAAAPNTFPAVLASRRVRPDPDDMTSVYAYGTAHAVVMVGSYGAEGLKPRQIGPAHATIVGRTRRALCGAWVGRDDEVAWPPEGYDGDQLCPECAELAAL
jgi:hypothetical protein